MSDISPVEIIAWIIIGIAVGSVGLFLTIMEEYRPLDDPLVIAAVESEKIESYAIGCAMSQSDYATAYLKDHLDEWVEGNKSSEDVPYYRDGTHKNCFDKCGLDLNHTDVKYMNDTEYDVHIFYDRCTKGYEGLCYDELWIGSPVGSVKLFSCSHTPEWTCEVQPYAHKRVKDQ